MDPAFLAALDRDWTAGDPELELLADELFADRIDLARRYYAHLATTGLEWGLIGPREVDRLLERHLLNCALAVELVPPGSDVLDVGSGAGLPGLVWAIARPDLRVTLLEPLQRRVRWLEQVIVDLQIPVAIIRGRAEELAQTAGRRPPQVTGRRSSGVTQGQSSTTRTASESGWPRGVTPGAVRLPGEVDWPGAAVVTARAVAGLGRLAEWCLPLTSPGGTVLALKGERAAEELDRDRRVLDSLGAQGEVIECDDPRLPQPTRVVAIRRRK